MIKTLIVDDKEIVRYAIKLTLNTSNEIEVVGECCNGDEAISFLHYNEVHVVIMDIKMPKMDGVEATKRITRLFPQIKVIIFSCYEGVFLGEKTTLNKISAFISKYDVGSDKLINEIKNCMLI